MPVSITKLKNGKYRVSTPNGIRAKGTTALKALKQKSILERYEEKKRRIDEVLSPLKSKRK